MWWLISEFFGNIVAYIAVILAIVAISKSLTLTDNVKSLENKLNGFMNNGINVKNVKQNNQQSNIQNSQPSNQNSVMNNITEDKIIDKSSNNNRVERDSAFTKWLKEDWLMKLGGLLVFSGVMIILSIVYDNIGPIGQISIGLLIGIIFSIFGFYWTTIRNVNAGMTINLIGCVIMITTIYFARTPEFNLFEPIIASIMILLITLYISFCALRFNLQQLAHIGLFVAGILPTLINSDSNNHVSLFIYLTIIILATLWLVYFKNWRWLIVNSICITLFYSFVYITNVWSHSVDNNMFLIVVLLGVVFLVNSVIGLIKSKGETYQVDVIIAFLNLIFAMSWIVGRLDETLWGIFAMVVAIIYLIAFYIVFQFTQRKEPFLVYAGSSSVLFMFATYYLLGENIIFWTFLLLESSIIVYSFYKISKADNIVTRLAALSSIFPAGYAISRLINGGLLVADITFIIYCILAITIFMLLYRTLKTNLKYIANIYFVASAIIFILFIWEFCKLISTSIGVATFISLCIYTAIGFAVLYYGHGNNREDLSKIGRGILVAIAIRVILIDAWQFDNEIIGIMICMVIGIILIIATIITRKDDTFKNKIGQKSLNDKS